MYSKVFSPTGFKKHLMLAVNVAMGAVAVVATVGSVQSIVSSAAHFKPFSSSA
jgi:hypothetical protein